MNEQEKKEWLAEWSREKLDDLIFKHATIGVDKATDGARAVSAVISHADELIVKHVQEDPPVSKPEIKWEVGKAYKTRDGSRAVFMGKNDYSDFVFQSLMHGDFKTMFNGRVYHLSESQLDIIGPWEEEPIKAQKTAAHCDHPKATWDDDKKIVACPRCGIDLADVYGRRSRLGKKDPSWLRDEAVDPHPERWRPRVSLRTAAQIAHERAVLRLRQHKLARWGRAQHVRWGEDGA